MPKLAETQEKQSALVGMEVTVKRIKPNGICDARDIQIGNIGTIYKLSTNSAGELMILVRFGAEAKPVHRIWFSSSELRLTSLRPTKREIRQNEYWKELVETSETLAKINAGVDCCLDGGSDAFFEEDDEAENHMAAVAGSLPQNTSFVTTPTTSRIKHGTLRNEEDVDNFFASRFGILH